MSDIAHKFTDEEIEKLEKRFAEEYQKALVEMENKASDYFEKFQKKDAKKRAELGMGKITEKEYKTWRDGQMAHGKGYTDLVNQLAQDMSSTNQMAMAALGERLPDIYSVSSNYQAYEMCKETGANISFGLVDHRTIEEVVKADEMFLPPKTDIKADERWNARKINSALTQGILQGDAIPKIADRLEQVSNMNRRASVRNARTMCTSAENAGRMSRFNEAEEKFGLLFDKIWISSNDNRTRDSHKDMSMGGVGGEQVPKDEEFSNGLMYPADPNGEPKEVYNCRCTMKSEYVGKRDELGNFKPFNKDESFEEWEEEKKEPEKETHTPEYESIKHIMDINGIEHKEVKETFFELTENQIIDKISGGDQTQGSCASLAMAYVANKKGLDVTDYRGGKSRSQFSYRSKREKIYITAGAEAQNFKVKKEARDVAKILKGIEQDKEFVFSAGHHCAIIKRDAEGLKYLELQCPYKEGNGWRSFGDDVSKTLVDRFACRKTVEGTGAQLIAVDDVKPTNEFKDLLGYMNTNTNDQMKGMSGNVK